MKRTRFVCFLLCLVLCLAACGQEPAPTTVPTTEPAPTTAPTEPAPTPAECYAAALEAQAAQTGYTLTISQDRQITAGGEAFSEGMEQILVRAADGTVQVDSELRFGGESIYTTEIFADDTVYLALNGTGFRSSISQADFLDRYTPAVLLDAANYGSITSEENGGGTTLTFTEAAAPESWLALPDVEFTDAEGTARLDANGNLVSSTYSLTYGYSGVSVTERYSVSITSAGAAPAVPDDAQQYREIQSIDGPVQLERAYFQLNGAKTLTGTSSQAIVSQAAAYACEIHKTVNETQGMYRFQTNITESDSSGRTNTYQLDEQFRDGVYTISENGGKAQEDATITPEILTSYRQQLLEDFILPADYMAQCTVTDLGGILLLECTGDEAWGESIRLLTCSAFLSDPYAIDNLATAIEEKEASFYLALDKILGVPTSYGFTYECSHTIQGQPLTLKNQASFSYDVGSLAAYENITEAPAPAAEAEAATPLLYKVTGTNGQQMWLFGTIHVGDDRTAYLPQALTDALISSDALALEFDSKTFEEKVATDAKLAAQVAAAYYYADGATIQSHLADEELYAKALQFMKASGDYNATADYMKPFLWKNSLDNFFVRMGHGLTAQKGLEARLQKLAEENNIPLREIESGIFQMEMMAGWSEPLQALLLKSMTDTDFVTYSREIQKLYDLWCAGDEAALTEMIRSEGADLAEEEAALYEEYNKSLSSDRNAAMLDVAKQYLESGDVVFYAVGLAHLLAEDGLVFTLRDAGYTVEQVTFG